MVHTKASAAFGLIGHSGAGKSACLKHLGLSLDSADMDIALDTKKRPTIFEIRDWLCRAPPLVGVSIHGDYRDWFRDVKTAGIAMIYLRKPVGELEPHLVLPMTSGAP